jgi:hypothetical protein
VRDADALRCYVEPRFLHQTRGRAGLFTDDLDQALRDGGEPQPWRVHYHVPLHAAPAPPLRATTGVLAAALGEVLGGPQAECDHFDVETYTWGVLPDGQRPETPAELAAGIAAELAYARDLMVALGLTQPQEVA